jgi:hypothetical protein
MSETLTPVEQRLLDELLQFHAARSRGETVSNVPGAEVPRFRQPLRRSHAAQNLLVFTAAIALGVLLLARLIGATAGPALAATPPPLHYTPAGANASSGRALLLLLAATAARQPPTRPASGRYAYVKTMGWYVTLGQGPGAGQVFPQTSQSWLRPNGSGRVINVTGAGSHRTVDELHVRSGPRLFQLATTTAGVARQLNVGHPVSDGPQERLVAFSDTASQQPIAPAAEAAILRLIARNPHLVNRGTVTDRAGRPGVAVSLAAPGLGTEYTLILSPHTGQLLGVEQTALRATANGQIRRGDVLAYTTIINAGYVANTSSLP